MVEIGPDQLNRKYFEFHKRIRAIYINLNAFFVNIEALIKYLLT